MNIIIHVCIENIYFECRSIVLLLVRKSKIRMVTILNNLFRPVYILYHNANVIVYGPQL
jgi:hypothetical protein